ncbi:peptidyl-prolyl cis-trans isomerase FKBP42-like isoform X2 [Malus domestica]|uniref:peptidyl-prolyl cis-trans isomerase FKBP42-like isoform X2 n=1 Tax=Malus domestica TaxID=3750 RepID=UPI0039751FC7
MEDVSGTWSRLSSKVHHLVKMVKENETVTEYATLVHGEPSQDANDPPKVDSKAEILHEKVTKQIIKEGHGQIPSKYSTCFLHYRAWTESTRHEFEDTWDEQRQLEMILGKEGSFSFPNVPPVADISYEVELIGFDETKEVSWSLAFKCLPK